MATDLEQKILDRLEPQVSNLGRITRRDIGRSALSAPAALAAARRGGPGAAIAVARSFHPQAPAGPTDMEVVSAKRALLDDMASFIKNKDSAKVGALGKIMAAEKANDQMLKIFEQYVKGNQDASKAVAQARIGMLGDMAGKYADAVRDQVGSTLSGGSGRAMEAYNAVRQQMFGGPGPGGMIMDPDTISKLSYNALYNFGLGPQDQAGVWALLEGEAAARGQDLRQLLEDAKGDGSSEAASLLANFDRIEDQVNSIQANALSEINAKNEAHLQSAFRQGAGMSMNTLVDAWQKFSQIYDPSAGAEDLQASLDTVFDALRPDEGSPDLLDNYEKLLGQLDDAGLDPASTLGEARRRLFADPAFKEFQRMHGLETPQAALKLMRRNINAQKRQRRMSDATKLRDMSAGRTASPGEVAAEADDSGTASAPKMPTSKGVRDIPPEQAIAEQRQMAEAFPAEGSVDLTKPHIVLDTEADEFMRWNPDTGRWDLDHPELDTFLEGLSALPQEGQNEVYTQLSGDFDTVMPHTQRRGAEKLKRQQSEEVATLTEETTPGKERKPFQIPSAGMMQAGVVNALFGAGAAQRKLTGAANKYLASLGKKKKKDDEEEEAGL